MTRNNAYPFKVLSYKFEIHFKKFIKLYIDIFYLLKYPYVPYSSFFEKIYVLVYVYQYHVILCFIAKLLSTNSPNIKTPFCTHMGPQLMIEGSCCIQPIIEVNAYIQRDKPGTDLIAK